MKFRIAEGAYMKRTLKLIFLTFACAAMLLAFVGCSEILDVTVTVMLADGEGYYVSSENPVTVKAGQPVSFSVELEPGYDVNTLSDGAVYENGKVILSRAMYPTTLKLETLKSFGKEYDFGLYDWMQNGALYANRQPGKYPGGSEITVKAEPKEGFKFIGWSTGETLTRGGTLYSRDAQLTFTLDKNTHLYANYANTVGVIYMNYDANGGVYAATGESTYLQECNTSFYLCPNNLAAMDYFVREGYHLLEYNTKPDGTGEAYSLGSKVILPKDGSEVTLYCIWAKESDEKLFEYKTNSTGVTVTGYMGNEDMIVIPEKLGGKTVTELGSKMIQNKDCTTVVFPKTLEKAGAAVIANCKNFTTLYMYDNIGYIPNDVISGTHKFTNFRLSAARAPAFSNSAEGNFVIKWERLVTSDKPVMVVMSGSSSLNGLDSPMLEKAFDGKYNVVNYGTNAGTSGVFYMEVLSHFMGEGDILIDAPEIGNTQDGAVDITWRLFRGTEMYINVWRYVDISRYKNLFSELTAFNKERANMGHLTYEHHSNSMNEYGDLQGGTRDQLNSPNYRAGSTFNFVGNQYNHKTDRDEQLNWIFGVLQDKGVTVYMSCPPYNANSLTAAAKKQESIDKFNQTVRDFIKVPYISDIKDYAIPGEWMYDSDYHPNAYGRTMRTEQLIKDLTAQMKKDGLLK